MSEVIGYSDEELIKRAVVHPAHRLAGDMPRWAVVKVVFCTGSTVAKALCRRFNVDPDEIVKGVNPDGDMYQKGYDDGRFSMTVL